MVSSSVKDDKLAAQLSASQEDIRRICQECQVHVTAMQFVLLGHSLLSELSLLSACFSLAAVCPSANWPSACTEVRLRPQASNHGSCYPHFLPESMFLAWEHSSSILSSPPGWKIGFPNVCNAQTAPRNRQKKSLAAYTATWARREGVRVKKELQKRQFSWRTNPSAFLLAIPSIQTSPSPIKKKPFGFPLPRAVRPPLLPHGGRTYGLEPNSVCSHI